MYFLTTVFVVRSSTNMLLCPFVCFVSFRFVCFVSFHFVKKNVCLNDQAYNCLIHLQDNCTVIVSIQYMCTLSPRYSYGTRCHNTYVAFCLDSQILGSNVLVWSRRSAIFRKLQLNQFELPAIFRQA